MQDVMGDPRQGEEPQLFKLEQGILSTLEKLRYQYIKRSSEEDSTVASNIKQKKGGRGKRKNNWHDLYYIRF